MALRRVALVHGPGIALHRPALLAWCAERALEWDLAVEPLRVADARELVAALAAELPAELPAAGVETGVVFAPGACGGDAAVQAAAAERAALPLTWLELEAVDGPPPAALARAGVRTVRGRGIDGHRWALRSVLERAAWPAREHAYGPGRDQRCDLRLPAGPPPPGGFPVVALLHGGAWRAQWERDLMEPLAVDLARRGFASWNVEYRRVGEGGGWPETFDDVAAALDLLADGALDAPLARDRVALLGHSAGGQLALWAAARGHGRSALVVSLAGLPDMEETARRAIYDDGAAALLGGRPRQRPERYARASPQGLLPLGVAQLLVHGTADQPDNVDMNRRYAELARAAGDTVELLELEGVEHFAPIEPRSAAWAAIAARLENLLPPEGAR